MALEFPKNTSLQAESPKGMVGQGQSMGQGAVLPPMGLRSPNGCVQVSFHLLLCSQALLVFVDQASAECILI